MARRKLAVAVALDLASLGIAIGAASMIVFGNPIPWVARSNVWVMLGALIGGGIGGILLSSRSAANGVPRPSYGRAVTQVGLMLATTATVIVFSRAFWSRNFILVSAVGWLALAFSHRWVRRRRPWTERMALVTNEKVLIDHLLSAPHAEVYTVLDPAGVVPDRPLPAGTTLAVDLRAVLSDDMARFVSSCNLAGYPMRSLVSVYEEHTGRLPIVHLMEGWELTVPLEGRGPYVRTKRVIDALLVLATSPLAILLGIVIASATWIDSRGPVIFKQRRIGLEGRPFTLYKFRTMHGPDHEPKFATQQQDRLTRVGRVLRRFRVDELPQLWNVIKGDLSLVGPRPEQGAFVDRFSETIPFYTHRHLVRPGITGWAQVNFGYADNQADTVEKLSYDLYYIKHVSPYLDLEVLGRSVWTVLSGYGAK